MPLKDFDIDDLIDEEEVLDLLKLKLPEPNLLDYYNRLLRRHIFLNEDVDDECAEYAYRIIQWNREDKDIPIEQRKKIKIFLHSDGGDVSAMNALISAIRLSKTPIITIGMGKIYSAAAMIFLASDIRLLMPTSRMMVHKGSSGIISDVNKIIDYSKFLEKDNELTKQYILERTNITEDKYREIEDKDYYLFPQECVELGIATDIVNDIEELF